MVFELLGRTLLHEIQDRGALEVSETKRCAACLLECLAFVHDEVGVLHTDVKPENVLLAGPAPVGRVKLVDLGTAFYVGRQGARDIQTREYRCPEGVLGLWPFGPAADVWSVGCLVFELLTGETLFDPQSLRRCAFVGSGHDLRCKEHGKAIDTHYDAVCTRIPTLPYNSVCALS